jgi:sugar phosphate isomerase/epimerase
MARTQLTLLNSMAGRDFEASLERHIEWGLRCLDLKDSIYGKGILDLTEAEGERATEKIQERGLSVYCLSTGLFFDDIENGPEAFRDRHLSRIGEVIRIAAQLHPRKIRLLAARSSRREGREPLEPLLRRHSWLMEMYREAVDRLAEAGFCITLENEVRDCLLTSPEDVLHFFELLDYRGRLEFTWDVQNMWQMGTFPTLEVYRKLKPLLGFVHLKGGQTDGEGTDLVWASGLEDASWPVVEIVRQVIQDGVSPVLCLNPSHGIQKPGHDEEETTRRDLEFLRRSFAEVE